MKKNISFLLAITLIVLSFAGCRITTTVNDETSEQADSTTEYLYDTTDYSQEETTVPVEIITGYDTSDEATTAEPVTVIVPAATQSTTSQTVSATPNYSSYTKAQIINVYANALNKTRAYTGSLTIHHKESFEGNVVEVNTTFGQSLAQQLANYIMGVLMDPTEEDLQFSGGKAQNSDGETVPILLPQKSSFSLPEAGVKSATISESNGTLKIHIQLVEEDVGFSEIPKYNAGAVGYLDTSKFTFNIVTIKSCTISYTGSTIDATIRPDGYIGECTYVINLSTTGEVSGLGVTGSGTIAGAQTEVWTLKW